MPDTIPTIPGPFSFLGNIGQAAGDTINAHTEAQLREQQRQMQQAQMLQQLIASGSVDPSQVQGPAAQGFYAASGGIDPRTLSTAPYTGAQEKAKQAKQQTELGGQQLQAGALSLQEQMQHADALKNLTPDMVKELYKIPGQVQVDTADDKALAEVAKRYVYATKGDAKSAFAAAQLQTMGETRGKLKEAYFGQAAAEYANEQKLIQAKLLEATRLNQGRGPGEVLDDYQRANIAQQDVLQKEIAKLGSPLLDSANPGNAKRRKDLQKELDEYMRQGHAINDAAMKLHNIPIPSPADPAVETAKQALASKQITVDDVRSSTQLTDAQKQQVLGTTPTAKPASKKKKPTVASGVK